LRKNLQLRWLLPYLSAAVLLTACDDRQQTKAAENPKNTTPGTRITKSIRAEENRNSEAPSTMRGSLEAAKRVTSPEDRRKAIVAAVLESADLEPDVALEALQELELGTPERARLVKHIGLRRAEQDMEAAIQWAASLKTPSEAAMAYGEISVVLAETDPARAASLISATGQPGKESEIAVVQIVQRWAQKSPTAAAAWAAQFPAGEVRSAALDAAVFQWSRRDPAAAVGWIQGIQDPTLRQEAQHAMATAIVNQPPSVSEQWENLAGPEIQQQVNALRQQAAAEEGEE
jgi:hypothetical protein